MSICQALGVSAGHAPLWNIKHNDFVFSCVRNPYDRAVSLFYYAQQTSPVFCEQFLKGNDGINEFWLNPDNLKRFRFGQPQTSWLNNAQRVDKIIRFERLLDDWAEIQSMHDLPALEHKNKSQRQPWQDELTDEAVAIIGKLYADDFEHLGYERIS
jgi:hypothetical protein